MSGSANRVILVGNLGADPEIRYTGNGTAVANFSIATSDNWTDKQGQKQVRTEWHRIEVWGRQAELCGEYLHKGRQVYVVGAAMLRPWTSQDGTQKTSLEVNVSEWSFIGSRQDSSDEQQQKKPKDFDDDIPF